MTLGVPILGCSNAFHMGWAFIKGWVYKCILMNIKYLYHNILFVKARQRAYLLLCRSRSSPGNRKSGSKHGISSPVLGEPRYMGESDAASGGGLSGFPPTKAGLKNITN